MTVSTQQPPVQETKSRSSWLNPWNWPMGVWALVIGLFLMTVPLGIRALILAQVPNMAEPFEIDEFVTWKGPADQNAFDDYHRAAQIYRSQKSASANLGEFENYNVV